MSGSLGAPELAAPGGNSKKFLIYEVFALALAGPVVFYGLERAVYWFKARQKKERRASLRTTVSWYISASLQLIIIYIGMYSFVGGNSSLKTFMMIGVTGYSPLWLGIFRFIK